jgi:hypothetical protein
MTVIDIDSFQLESIRTNGTLINFLNQTIETAYI